MNIEQHKTLCSVCGIDIADKDQIENIKGEVTCESCETKRTIQDETN